MLCFGSLEPFSGKPAVDAYTNFPNFCCRCLQSNPQGSWQIKNSQRTKLETGTVVVREVSVRVPLCGRCRWDIRLRDVGGLGVAFSVASLALGLWYWNMPKRDYLPFGVILALFVFFLVAIVLGCVLGPRRVAYLEPDGSDITFANPQYQRMYTGESRPGRQDEVDWRHINWR
jgi:hypothetical protein